MVVAFKACFLFEFFVFCIGSFTEVLREGNRSHAHFKTSTTPHPLKSYEEDEYAAGDHSGRQQNHIWTKEELDTLLTTLYRHKPKTVTDKIVNALVSDSC